MDFNFGYTRAPPRFAQNFDEHDVDYYRKQWSEILTAAFLIDSSDGAASMPCTTDARKRLALASPDVRKWQPNDSANDEPMSGQRRCEYADRVTTDLESSWMVRKTIIELLLRSGVRKIPSSRSGSGAARCGDRRRFAQRLIRLQLNRVFVYVAPEGGKATEHQRQGRHSDRP